MLVGIEFSKPYPVIAEENRPVELFHFSQPFRDQRPTMWIKRVRKSCLRKNHYSSVTVYSYQIGAAHLHTAEALNVPLLSPELWAWIAGCPFMKIGGSTRSGWGSMHFAN